MPLSNTFPAVSQGQYSANTLPLSGLPDAPQPEIVISPEGFDEWEALLDLLRQAFAHTIGRVEPPSTVYSCTAADLARRADREHLMIARSSAQLAGCLFLKEAKDELFLGRFAVRAEHKGGGLARRMIERASTLARQCCKTRLVLETRTTLVENQAKFRALGFEITGGRAHAGYHGITTYRMTCRLD